MALQHGRNEAIDVHDTNNDELPHATTPLPTGLARGVESDMSSAATTRAATLPSVTTEPLQQPHLQHEKVAKDDVTDSESSPMEGIQTFAGGASGVPPEELATATSASATGTHHGHSSDADHSNVNQSTDHGTLSDAGSSIPAPLASPGLPYVSTPSIDSDSSNMDDSDSALGSFGMMSSTMSVNSSIYEHVEENGRTYHRYKEGKYFLPNDETERDRLDLQHALFGLTFHNSLYLAPIGNHPQRVLDMATGTGIWAIDFANMHPSAEVIGTDLSAIQPELGVPPNCHFEIDDAEDEWTFSRPFDYIHGRALGTCFTDPGAVIAKAFNSLLPGGYLEMQDAIMPMKYVGEVPIKSSLYQWNQHVLTASTMAKRPWTNVINYPQYFQDAGFEDIQVRKFYWPSNAWPKGTYFKTLSAYFQQDLMEGLEGLSMKLFTNLLGWTKEQVQQFLVGVREDLKDRSIHAYVEISVVHGRRPAVARTS